MATVFRDIPVEQLCTKVTTGATPLRSRSDYYEAGTIDWYKTGELKDWYLAPAEERITKKALEETSVKLFPADTVLMAMYGDGRTITSLGMLRAPAATNQACSAMLVDETKCDTRYFFYALKERRHLLLKVAAGGAQRNLSGRLVKEFILPIPPLPVQRHIAGILSAYDGLIENNTRRIQILERMAQALYREWFVNFRFPGHAQVKLVASPLGKSPQGWEVQSLETYCHLVMGQSPASEFYNERGDGLPFHQGVTDFGEHFPTDRVFCTANNRIAETGDILFSVRAPVGRINLADKRIVIGRGVSAIRSRAGQQTFLLFQLKDKFKEEDSMGGGTIFKSVTKEDMQKISLLLPPTGVVEQFESIARPMVTLLEYLTKKNANLRRTRDLLLPKLISGALDVSKLDIETGNHIP